MVTRALGLLAATVVLGCGSGGGGGDDDDNRLRIEMRPVSAIAWSGVFEADDAPVVRASDVVTFAWGGDYPRALEVTVGPAYATCGPLSGTLTLDEIDSQDDALEVELTGAASFRLAPSGEGDFEAIVRGSFVADPITGSCVGDEAPIELHVSVPVRRPTAIRIDPPDACDGASFRVESEAPLAPGLFVRLVDADGGEFSPRNATATHPIALELVADADTELALRAPDDGLAALVVSGAPGPVSVRALDEEQHVVELVARADIDVIDVRFSLLGNAGGPTPLESGQTYGENGWARTTSSIGIASSGMTVDGAQICTAPSGAGFVLESDTPANCIVFDALGHGVGPYGEQVFDLAVPLSADVMASGTCVLQLDGPEYDGGAGFSAELDVEILNAESLPHFEGR